MGEFYSAQNRKKTSQFDRYKSCKVLTDISTKEVLLETRDIKNVKFDTSDKYHTVKPNESGRLDIISYEYYGNPLLWWVIAQANDIYNPLYKPESGDIIRIPSLTRMYDKGGILL